MAQEKLREKWNRRSFKAFTFCILASILTFFLVEGMVSGTMKIDFLSLIIIIFMVFMDLLLLTNAIASWFHVDIFKHLGLKNHKKALPRKRQKDRHFDKIV